MLFYVRVQREVWVMFLRRIRPQGRGSKHTYLGKLSAKEISGWDKLTGLLDGKSAPAPGLFAPADDPDVHEVDAAQVIGSESGPS
jgi:hypothetical protein